MRTNAVRQNGNDVQESRNGVQHAYHSIALLLMSSDGERMAAQMNLTNSHLATDHAAFAPLAYQQGSVWAFDNALIVSGLRRYGEDAAALRVTAATLDAARGFRNGRLPEFIARAQRLPGDAPTHKPRADPLQAWSAAATPFMVSELLSLSADGFAKRLISAAHSCQTAWARWRCTGSMSGTPWCHCDSQEMGNARPQPLFPTTTASRFSSNDEPHPTCEQTAGIVILGERPTMPHTIVAWYKAQRGAPRQVASTMPAWVGRDAI